MNTATTKWLLAGVLLLAILTCGQLQAASPEDCLKRAIAMVETGDNDNAIGAAGETTRYQLSPDVIKRFGKDPQAYLDWIAAQLKRRGVYPCVFNVALAYTAGVEATATGKARVEKYRYAVRVQALYDHLLKQ